MESKPSLVYSSFHYFLENPSKILLLFWRVMVNLKSNKDWKATTNKEKIYSRSEGYQLRSKAMISARADSTSLFVMFASKFPGTFPNAISSCAVFKRIWILSSVSVPRFLKRDSNSSIEGGEMKMYLHCKELSLTFCTPWISISKMQILPLDCTCTNERFISNIRMSSRGGERNYYRQDAWNWSF